MNYYPHNIGDFASLTQGLDLEAVGIVVRLLDRLMLTEKPIKTQWVSIGFPKEANDKVMAVLAALFEETPDDVETQHWSDWLQTRKAKKLPLTQTALDGIRREAEKAGLSLDQAIAVCCERGWAGFKASWYEKDKTEQNVAPRGAEIKCSGQYYGEPGQIGWS